MLAEKLSPNGFMVGITEWLFTICSLNNILCKIWHKIQGYFCSFSSLLRNNLLSHLNTLWILFHYDIQAVSPSCSVFFSLPCTILCILQSLYEHNHVVNKTMVVNCSLNMSFESIKISRYGPLWLTYFTRIFFSM